jgi:hypothetical protein
VALISQREYARRRGVSGEAVRKRTVVMGGPIPVHGPRKLIDEAEADRLWWATMSPGGASTSRFQGPVAPAAPAAVAAAVGRMEAMTQARTALVLTETQLRRLRLDERRGQVLDRQATLAHFLETMHAMRDAFAAWPARVAADLAADLGVDAAQVQRALVPYVQRQLDELADVRLDLGHAVRR